MVTRQTSGSASQSQSSRTRAIEAYDGARRKAAGGIEDAPLLALAGGLAVADRIRTQAGDAVDAARSAGQARLDELGLTRNKGSETLRSIVEGAGDAFKASAEAAVASIRGTQD